MREKINKEEASVMRVLYEIGWSLERIASVFGCCHTTVSYNIANARKAYRGGDTNFEYVKMMEIVSDVRRASSKAMANALRKAADELDPPQPPQPLTEHAQALKLS